MPKFMWEGRTRVGGTMTGEVEAPNEAFVIAQLRRQQIVPVTVKPKPRELRMQLPGRRGKVSKRELAVFTRQFATMIDAGLPLVQCLDILGMQQENEGFKKVILRVKEDVESGSTFADALSKHPRVFDELFVNLVSAGEVGGILDTILARLAAYIEKAMKLAKQIKSAMVYPATILAVAIIVTIVLLLYVIPIFGEMFKDFGQALPVPTQIVLALGGSRSRARGTSGQRPRGTGSSKSPSSRPGRASARGRRSRSRSRTARCFPVWGARWGAGGGRRARAPRRST